MGPGHLDLDQAQLTSQSLSHCLFPYGHPGLTSREAQRPLLILFFPNSASLEYGTVVRNEVIFWCLPVSAPLVSVPKWSQQQPQCGFSLVTGVTLGWTHTTFIYTGTPCSQPFPGAHTCQCPVFLKIQKAHHLLFWFWAKWYIFLLGTQRTQWCTWQ